jgi:hypothetical protein
MRVLKSAREPGVGRFVVIVAEPVVFWYNHVSETLMSPSS